MKDLETRELEQYKVQPPQETALGYSSLFTGSKVYSFEIPLKQEILRTIIAICKWKGSISSRISASIHDENKTFRRIVNQNEVYVLKDYLLNEEECLVWQYNPIIEGLRAANYRQYTGRNFDMNDAILQLNEFKGSLPPFKEAYERKMQKNKGFFYGKGKHGEWEFVHMCTDKENPWSQLKQISKREFGNNLVQVFFNQETREHPDEFIIWYNPNSEYLL